MIIIIIEKNIFIKIKFFYFQIQQKLLISDAKYWCQHNSRNVSHDFYVFWIFFTEGITVPRFTIVRYV